MGPMLKKAAMELLSRTPLRRAVFPHYDYCFSVPQLIFLCQCLEETRSIPGAIAEIGCAAGATTIFLNRYLDATDIEKPYYCLDTFSGFVREDVDTEVAERGKDVAGYSGFQSNKREWFDTTMRANGVRRVISIEADVNCFDLPSLGALSFVLLDVDLYRPIRHALPQLWTQLSPGGVIVVDDCQTAPGLFDGAGAAYREFAGKIGAPVDVHHGKLGVLRKSNMMDRH